MKIITMSVDAKTSTKPGHIILLSSNSDDFER